LAGSTTKKVHIVRFDREPLSGFVNPTSYLTSVGVEVLNLSGNVSVVPFIEIKAVQFVRDFEDGSTMPERRAFLSRPKMDGLWVKLVFRDDEQLEGVLPNNLLQLEPFGFTIVPPDFSYTNQRMFVPRAALREMHVLGVVGSALRRGKGKADKDQIKLFE
jgi:hypothetical protein